MTLFCYKQDRKSTLFCWFGCKQIVFNVVVENNETHHLRRASICQPTLLSKVDTKFIRWGDERGAHVKEVGMFFVVSFWVINCEFFSGQVSYLCHH